MKRKKIGNDPTILKKLRQEFKEKEQEAEKQLELIQKFKDKENTIRLDMKFYKNIYKLLGSHDPFSKIKTSNDIVLLPIDIANTVLAPPNIIKRRAIFSLTCQ